MNGMTRPGSLRCVPRTRSIPLLKNQQFLRVSSLLRVTNTPNSRIGRWLLLCIKAHRGHRMLKLEPSSDGKRTVVRLIKRAGAEHLGEIMNQLGRSSPKAALDSEEVTVVDVHVVRLLGRCEKQGTEL